MTTVRQQMEQRKPGELITSIMPVEFKELVVMLLDESTDTSVLHKVDSMLVTKAQFTQAKKLLCIANLIHNSPESFALLLQDNWEQLYFRAVGNGEMAAEIMKCRRGES